MNLRHLRYLVVLAEERHFHRAAERLHIGQSTLSAALRQLEQEVGLALVERDRRRFGALTEAGVVAVAEARRVLGACEAMETALSGVAGELTGQVVLGVIPTAEPLLPRLTRAIAETTPRVSLLERLMTTRGILREVLDRSIHAGIAYADFDLDPQLQVHPLYQERYVVCGPARLLPRSRRAMPWSEAARLPLVLLSPDMRNRQILDRHLGAIGIVPAPSIELNSLLAVITHLHAGDHCAILPEAAAGLATGAPGVVARPLGEPALAVPVGLILRREVPMTPLSRALLAAASRAWIEGAPAR